MHDLIIIGTGAAGLSAAIYAARFRLKTAVLGKVAGGTLVDAHLVENWPGVISTSGFELMKNIEKHVKSYNVEIVEGEVIDAGKKGKNFLLKTREKEYETRTIIFATGTERRKLNVPGGKEFENKGVSYCAACDAALFKGKAVAVVGGSDSAAKEALLIAEYAKKVYIIYRREKIRAEPINKERVEKNEKIEIIINSNVVEILGDKNVKKVKLDSGKEMEVQGVFVEIGATPLSALATKLGVILNEKKEIVVDENSKTNVLGIFAAGDVTNAKFKQAITAASQGVIAAFSAYEFNEKED